MEKHDTLKGILHAASIGGGGTSDYNKLINIPTLNGTELKGDLSLEDIGITMVTPAEIDELMDK